MPGPDTFTHGSMGRTESMDRYWCWRTKERELEDGGGCGLVVSGAEEGEDCVGWFGG